MKQRFLVFLLLTGVVFFPHVTFAKNAEHIKKEVTLAQCVDGDTAWFFVDGEKTKVRFLAIDTKETVHPTKGVEAWGKDASEFTCNKMKQAKTILLEYDPGSSKTDKYGRDLAWVYVDSELLQESLVQVGYAEVKYIYGSYLYTDRLKEVEEEAKSQKLGIWSSESDDTNVTSEEEVDSPEAGIDFVLIVVFVLGAGMLLFLPKKYQTKAKKVMKQVKKQMEK